jgi:crotonobetainyl-CoA:carnitine CoA-transferase CaiB-like acyl-CoA transferase
MPFQSLRVLELAGLPATSFCARLFADFGAEVTKVMSLEEQQLCEQAHDCAADDALGGAWFTFLNFNKRLLPRNRLSDAELQKLVSECDVLLSAGMSSLPASLDNPALIHVNVSWFGRSGPYSAFAGTDAVCRALAGNIQLAGPREGPPISAPDFQAGIVGGLWAFVAATAGLVAHERDGRHRLETSIHEACVTLAEYQVAEAWAHGQPQQRMGINRFAPTYPLGIYPTKDDWLGVTLVTPAQWRDFCAMLGLPSLGNDPRFVTGAERLPFAGELEARFMPLLKNRPAAEWFTEGLRRKLPMVVVPAIATLVRSDEMQRRRAVVPVKVGSKTVMAPGSPLRLCATPPRAGGMLDAVARSSVQWPARDGRRLFPAPAGGTSALPLAGFRIVDFTMGWAGPLCTRTLADLGADIVKIESCSYPDWWRGVDRRPDVLREKLYEKTARFAVMNRNKRGVTIDLTRPEGVRLVKALVMHSDAVVDNYSVDVLPKFGLGPDVLRALKPQLVTLSMSAFGSDSPWRECRAYGSTLEQGSGLPLLVGREDDVPVMGHPAYGDPIGGLSGAAALLTALLHARRTGEGQHIDLSQVECMMQMTAPWMIAHSLTGREPVRFGAGHPDYAPHGTYRCAGDDEWLLLAVTDDTQWQSLCALIGRADLAADPSLARAAQRRARADEIDVAIGAWTIQRSTEEAMMSLQGAGLAAGAVRRPADLLRDPHLLARGFWQSVERDYIGVQPQPSPAIREHEAPYLVRHPAPTLGESNADVFGSILGLSRQEIAALEDAGIIGTTLIIAEDKQLRRTSA